MDAIGGYFSLELPSFPEYHSNGIRLNCGRSCLEYILRCRKYSKVYVPYFTCDSVIEPLVKLKIDYVFYHIDNYYHIVDEIHLKSNEALLYTNYWGLQTEYCTELSRIYGCQLILDYTQAFFEKPLSGIDSFNSCRKFFGVPDGGYLFTEVQTDLSLEQDLSYDRLDSLVKRIDISPEAGYTDFHNTEMVFSKIGIRTMSRFTSRMMCSIDYPAIALRRRLNYEILYQSLGGICLPQEVVPMVFPYSSEKGQLIRQHLINNKIYVAKYWPNVDEWSPSGSYEKWMCNHIIPLPIDQRYGIQEMSEIADIIRQFK